MTQLALDQQSAVFHDLGPDPERPGYRLYSIRQDAFAWRIPNRQVREQAHRAKGQRARDTHEFLMQRGTTAKGGTANGKAPDPRRPRRA